MREKKARVHVCTICDEDVRRIRLRNAVRFTYDLQHLRIATLQRGTEKGGDAPPVDLDDDDRKFIQCQSDGLKALERQAFKEIERHASKFKVWEWLDAQKGIGPAGGGVLLSEFDIHIGDRPSKFWSFAGLGVGDDGHGQHPESGAALAYNSWLRSKCLNVIGGGLLKAANEQYRVIYDGYKHRKATQFGPCMLCGGTGKAKQPKKVDGRVSTDAGKAKTCWNCVGEGFTPERAPWGKGDAHRHMAALRYMVKMFLADFWRAWREAEGLPVVPTYHEAMRGYAHKGEPANV